MKVENKHFVVFILENLLFTSLSVGELIISIKTIMNSIETEEIYDYDKLVEEISVKVGYDRAWDGLKALRIKFLTLKEERGIFLSPNGNLLKKYIDEKTVEELFEIYIDSKLPCRCLGDVHKECKNPFLPDFVAAVNGSG